MKSAHPWYRERWPWILMSGPATVIVAGAMTTWIAFATSDGLVADDYYKRGLAVNVVLEREQAAAKRGIEARIEKRGERMHVSLSGDQPPVLWLRLAHATRAGEDIRLRLERGPDGAYEAALPPLAPGARRLILEDDRGTWRIVKEGR
jgi:hypothetical protein